MATRSQPNQQSSRRHRAGDAPAGGAGPGGGEWPYLADESRERRPAATGSGIYSARGTPPGGGAGDTGPARRSADSALPTARLALPIKSHEDVEEGWFQSS